jgi:hypothetical protein
MSVATASIFAFAFFSLIVLVSVPHESLRCRSCGCGRVHLHESRDRFGKAAPLGLTPVFVTMKTARVKCQQCGSKTWHQPAFAEGQRRITKCSERYLEAWLSRVTMPSVFDRVTLQSHFVKQCVRGQADSPLLEPSLSAAGRSWCRFLEQMRLV